MSTAKKAPALLWRYSVRWGLPHLPCPGPVELAAVEVPAGTRWENCPPEIRAHWKPGTGYAVSLDFPPAGPVRRWSDARRADVRRRNLAKRIERDAPLFADELIQRELSASPEYFSGKRFGG